jgi:hypothetical protein
MQRAIVIVLLFLSFGLKAQVYQAMPQAGYGPVKRFLTDSVLTIPTGINSLRNITGGRDAGQIRWNTTDSGFYVYSGYQWIKINIDSVSLSNRINGKLNISDTASMLSAYLRKGDTLSLSNRINLRVKYSDTASMLLPYLRKLDTASLSDRINKKMDSLILTTIGTGGLATLLGTTLNIPNYGGALTGYVPYSGATNDVTLGARNLTGTLINADYSLQIKNEVGAGGASTLGYTSISSNNSGYYFYTSYSGGQKGAYFNYPASGTTFSYNLPVRAGTIALVEDTVSLSNRINAKIGATDTVSLSDRINLRVKYSDTASMLSPYLRKGDTSSLSNRINLKLNSSDTASLSNRINLKLNISDTASMLSNYQSAINARVKYSDTAAMLDPYLTAAVTSVGLSMPVAFNVSNSPITSTGTIAVTGAGTAAQYIRGDGQLATLPSGASGGSSVDYYLNGGTSQGTIGGSTYYEMSKIAVIGTNADFSRTNAQGNGLIAQFITDSLDPNRTEIPAGAWNFEMFFSSSSSGGLPTYYIELLKYDGTNFTTIASDSANPEGITGGTTIDLYLTSLAIPFTALSITDRLVVRVYVTTSGKTITLHTQNGHLCLITTSFAGGVTSLNGLAANTQYLAVDTVGSDFNINSLVDTHTFNLPTASATNRGALSSADWSTFNGKMNYADTVSLSNRINTKLNSADTASLSNRINAKADALSGTTNTVPKFISATTIGNSNIKDNGNAVTINATAGSNGALQVGSYGGNILMNTDNSSGGLIFKNTSSSNKLWDFSSYNNDINFNESGVATPVITLQAGGNVGIKTITPSYQLEVNGTFKSGGIATFGSTLSNGTYNYTLPSATGTLALTSQLTSGTVTSIATGLGLSGGTITTSGTLLVDTSSASILSRQRAANTYATTSALSGYLPLSAGSSFPLTGDLYIRKTDGFQNLIIQPTTTTSAAGTRFLSTGNDMYMFIDNSGGDYGPTGANGASFAYNANIRVVGNRALQIATNDIVRMTISSTGNVLIGTTTDAGYKLDVNGTGRFSGDITFSKNSPSIFMNNATSFTTGQRGAWYTQNSAGSATTLIQASAITDNVGTSLEFYTRPAAGSLTQVFSLASTGAATFSSNLTVSSGRTELKGISDIYSLGLGYSSSASALFYIGVSADTSPDLIFSNGSPTERMRITSGGNVGIGTTSPGYKLDVLGSASDWAAHYKSSAGSQPDVYLADGSGNGGIFVNTRNTTSTNNALLLSNGTNFLFTVNNAGTVTINTLGTGVVYSLAGALTSTNPSDSSLKNSISPLSYGLTEILKLQPKKFYYNSDTAKASLKYGFIAQDVQLIMPDIVRTLGNGSDKLGLESDGIYVTMVNAIQELSAKNEALIKRIETLENK